MYLSIHVPDDRSSPFPASQSTLRFFQIHNTAALSTVSIDLPFPSQKQIYLLLLSKPPTISEPKPNSKPISKTEKQVRQYSPQKYPNAQQMTPQATASPIAPANLLYSANNSSTSPNLNSAAEPISRNRFLGGLMRRSSARASVALRSSLAWLVVRSRGGGWEEG